MRSPTSKFQEVSHLITVRILEHTAKVHYISWPAPEFLALIAYVQKHPLTAPPDIYNGARGPNFDLSNHLDPYLVYVSNEGSWESARLGRLA